jgi:hypothetical protein
MSQSPFSDAAGNPYRSPAPATASSEIPTVGAMAVTERSVELLRATRPWVRFLSVVGFIGAGLMVLGGLFAAVFGLSQGQFEMVGAAAFYMVIGLLYFFGALYLGRYASAISTLETVRSTLTLEEALAAQKTLWRYFGILMAVVLCLYVAIFAIAMLALIGSKVMR